MFRLGSYSEKCAYFTTVKYVIRFLQWKMFLFYYSEVWLDPYNKMLD